MTRYEAFAAAALSGLLGGRVGREDAFVSWDDVVRDAFEVADAMEAEAQRRWREASLHDRR